jgi:hypothetical protein
MVVAGEKVWLEGDVVMGRVVDDDGVFFSSCVSL